VWRLLTRPSQSLINKVLSFSAEKKISAEEVALITGAPRGDLVNSFVDAISQKNLSEGLAVLQHAVAENISVPMFIKLVLQKMRWVMLLKYGGEGVSDRIQKSLSAEDFTFVSKLGEVKESGVTSATLSRLLLAYETSLRVFSSELAIELALVDLFQK
jgi:DNA polymerase III gamma/tau subunit